MEVTVFKVLSNGQVNKMKFRNNLYTSFHAALREEWKMTGHRDGCERIFQSTWGESEGRR